MFVKIANAEVLEVKSSPTQAKVATLNKFADFNEYRTDDGYIYVRVRAISSRVNKNHDGWPSEELQKAYRTFIGKPIFVDHHNSDPKKARGVVVDAALHVEEDQKTSALDPYYSSAPAEHLPPTWIELLLEVDAKKFPKLAKAIVAGEIDGVSMGCNVEKSKCSHCGNWAHNPEQYCKHILSKGAYFDYDDEFGNKLSKRSYEDCYDIGFFELSFVFDPADETAGAFGEIKTAKLAEIVKEAIGQYPDYPEPDDPQEFGDYEDDSSLAVDPANRENEGERVKAWVVQQLLAEGFSPEQAEQIAEMRWADHEGNQLPYDWHDMIKVKQQGATPEQAMQMYHAKRMHAQVMEDSRLFDKVGGWPLMDEMKGLAGGIQKGVGQIPGIGDTLQKGMQQLPQTLQQGMQQAPQMIQQGLGQIPGIGDTLQQGMQQGEQMLQHPQDIPGQIGNAFQELPWNPQQQGLNPEELPFDPTKQPQFQQMMGSTKTADNPIPQSEMTTAPDKVDTLRQEQVCPICGSDGMEDGVCPVCNYEEPPEGFDNPDLEKAKEVDQQMRQEDAQQAQEQPQDQQQPQAPMPGGGPPGGAQGVPGAAQPITSSSSSTYAVNIEQKVSAAPKGTRINTQERPILPVARKLNDRPLNPRTIKDSVKPVESNRKDNMETTQKTADGASPQGEGVAADERVDVTGVGGVGPDPLAGIEHQNVESEEGGNEVGPHTDTWSGEEGDSLPSADAVTTTPFPSEGGVTSSLEVTEWPTGIEKTAEGGDMFAERDPGNGFPFEQKPTRVDLLGDLKEEVGDSTSTDPNEQYRSQKHTNPVTNEDPNALLGGPIGEALSAAKAQVFKAFKVADTEIELGITDPEARYDRVTELENTDESALDAQLETLSKVKTAGLKKSTGKPVVAGRMPSFKPVTASFDIEANSVSDSEVEDSLW